MDTYQTFVAYNWGVYARHRDYLRRRFDTVGATILQVVRKPVQEQFGVGGLIFRPGRLPGFYLERFS